MRDLLEEYHGLPLASPREDRERIAWARPAARCGRIRVRLHTCSRCVPCYEFCVAAGLAFVRRSVDARRHDEILAAGVREVAVFHSTVEAMLPYQGDLPFSAVADPARRLYTRFGVGVSPRAGLHPRVWVAALRGAAAGQGAPPARGESALGLPADFLIAPGGKIVACRYGRHADDQWSVDELLHLARNTVDGDDRRRFAAPADDH